MPKSIKKSRNPFGLSNSDAGRVRINALQTFYTLWAEQENIKGKISVREVVGKERMSA